MYERIIITDREIEGLKAKDEKMKLLIETIGDINRDYIKNPFIALVHSIVYQQLAIKAATAIWNRFCETVTLTPESLLYTSDELLRTCGLSRTKITYIKNIARAVVQRDLTLEKLTHMSDADIIEQLTYIKGIGTWTAEMFLIFSLNRKDVMSYKDLAILKGLKWLYNMKNLPTMTQFEKLKKKFTPYNTLASLYLWEVTTRNFYKYKLIDTVLLQHNVTYLESPIGLVEIQAEQGEIIRLGFVKEKRYEEKLEPILVEAKNQLNAYFKGDRDTFDLPFKINGTTFQSKVWTELSNIPYGETRSYKDIAIGIGNEKASRAIGNANNKNKIAILIPCHRVVGTKGKLVGYEGGLWRKEWLLKHEGSYKS
ncbi:Methylated-DNA--protein-cysteine methyltransferase [Haloplasma contractile SSD-17B]|uniref:Methylated-DNA--protein-cysteine methyltransferase n=1 Tax=Haloplasma contractile SSD-17B TaxID=1033810 RepID=F7PTR1_9MOLU|nr:methylated-DNA--[protein]-cysteine S-methyltransferase [Haloplasma contractile]ERJ12224.1 Methylated-DNA--protein-cysteine methyltransferase [Haloplasma contractile SSD-17B]